VLKESKEMSTQRKQYSAEFKARTVLEALKELKTVHELASAYLTLRYTSKGSYSCCIIQHMLDILLSPLLNVGQFPV